MAKEEQKVNQLNVRIKDGDQFYSNETSINFNPNEIVLDFKCLTHTHEMGDHRSLILKHSVVILNPFHAKAFLGTLSNAIKDFEAKFGEIKKSDAIKKAEKIVKKEQKKAVDDSKIKISKSKDDEDNYFG